MKAITIIENCNCKGCPANRASAECVMCLNDRTKREQVPETFEELKELCKNLESKNVFVKNVWNCIEFNGLSFWQDGRISHDADQSMYAIKLDVTPARQWQIIKSLIGEE